LSQYFIDKEILAPDEEMFSGDLITVDNTGCGCILYKTEVFENIEPPWFEFTETEDGRPMGEDITFCKKLKEAGYEIFVDTSIVIGHISLLEVNRATYEVYKLISKAKHKGETT
jgi:hypothetical protein